MALLSATPHASTDPILIQRLETLERQARLLKLVVIGLVSSLGVLSLLGLSPDPHKRIEAEEFVLRDQAGRVRAKLSADPTSSPVGIPP